MSLTAIPLIREKFFKLMQAVGPFEEKPHIAVAVSGGADSLALSLLLQDWLTPLEGKLTALTVDHKLRVESTEEAYQVKKWLTRYGINHHIMTWEGDKKGTDIQNRARHARKQLLTQWCQTHHVLHLCIAHHADDQAETFMQRLLHGSGPIGLQAMAICSYTSFGRILRPLLTIFKKDLQAYLQEKGQDYIEDPSNQNPIFERTKIRFLLPSLIDITTTIAPLNQTVEKIQQSNEIILESLTQFYVNHAKITKFGVVTINKKALLIQNIALQGQILSRGLQGVGGSKYPFSVKQLVTVIHSLHLNKNTTLGGCLIMIKKEEIWIVREKRSIPKSTKVTSNRCLWDHRFLLTVPDTLINSIIIPHPGPFEEKVNDLPEYVKATLPCLIDPQGNTHFFSDLSLNLSFQNNLLPSINIMFQSYK